MLEIKELTGGYVNIPVLKDVSFETHEPDFPALAQLAEKIAQA